MWTFDICEKEMKDITRWKYNISNAHIHKKTKKNLCIAVEKYELFDRDFDERVYILRDVTKDCTEIFFMLSNIDVFMTLNLRTM